MDPAYLTGLAVFSGSVVGALMLAHVGLAHEEA